MQLYYTENIDSNTCTLSPEESAHISGTLRMKAGSKIRLTDGKGNMAFATLVIADKKKCVVEIYEKQLTEKSWKFDLQLAIAPTKVINRIEWLVEKTVEMGIDKISFIQCQNSEKMFINTDRMQRLAIAASKQSIKAHFPVIEDIQNFQTVLEQSKGRKILFPHCREGAKTSLKDWLPSHLKDNYTVFIGPEGDFSEKEIDDALTANALGITLGDTRLRTETAGLFVCNAVHLFHD